MNEYEIRADYDERSIVVYQAYSPAIALPAIRSNSFVPPFSMNRMTWIKPSFLWMMERCGWGRKSGQEMILAVRITREGWEKALSQAALTSYDARIYSSYEEWQKQLAISPVRVQWDPERSIRGGRLQVNSIQVGLGRPVVPAFVHEWIISISDLTPLVHKISGLLRDGAESKAKTLLPRERPYPLSQDLSRRLIPH